MRPTPRSLPPPGLIFTLFAIGLKTLLLSLAIGVGIVAVDWRADLLSQTRGAQLLLWILVVLFWGGIIASIIGMMVLLQAPLLGVWVAVRPGKTLAPWLDAVVGLVLGVVFVLFAMEPLTAGFAHLEWRGATGIGVVCVSTLVGYWSGACEAASAEAAARVTAASRVRARSLVLLLTRPKRRMPSWGLGS